jgi:hypothetical protein
MALCIHPEASKYTRCVSCKGRQQKEKCHSNSIALRDAVPRREYRTLVYFIYLLHIRPLVIAITHFVRSQMRREIYVNFFCIQPIASAIYLQAALVLLLQPRVTSLAARLNNEFQRDMNAAHTVLSTLYYIPC